MGSLCGQVNMPQRMNHSAVAFFLFPLKADRTETETGPQMPIQEKASDEFFTQSDKLLWPDISDSTQVLYPHPTLIQTLTHAGPLL